MKKKEIQLDEMDLQDKNKLKDKKEVQEQSKECQDPEDTCMKNVSRECEEDAPCRENDKDAGEEIELQAKKSEEYFNMLQRTLAEYDNYRKRTTKEKESIYSDAVGDTVMALLPVLDNLYRAVHSGKENTNYQKLLEGVDMVLKQFIDCLGKIGVEEIKSIGETFNPEVHNAVMHIEDESMRENTIVEEFQKGYQLNGKVIRYSMVKVAN